MLIGLTGKNGSGKGEVARCLQERGFEYHSLSDAIRDEIRARGEEPSRDLLIQTGNDLREHLGAGVLAHRILRKVGRDVNVVIDSIRNPAEVDTLKSTEHFRLVEVVADPETRFERIRARNREGDPIDHDRFMELEGREASGNASSQNLVAVGELADCALENTGSLKELEGAVAELLLRLLKEIPRPGWDQYFMDIARVAASRSNCLKRKVAAIIVRAHATARLLPSAGGSPSPSLKYISKPSPVFFSTLPPYSSAILIISEKNRFSTLSVISCSLTVDMSRSEKPQMSRNITAI